MIETVKNRVELCNSNTAFLIMYPEHAEDEDDIIIWTVVTLSLVDYDALEPLYEAEIRAMQIADAPIFDFHVVSTSQGRLVEDLVPKQAKKIWKR